MPLDFRGPHLKFLHDDSAAIDLEGSLSCGKTTVCLYRMWAQYRKFWIESKAVGVESRAYNNAPSLYLRAKQKTWRAANSALFAAAPPSAPLRCPGGARRPYASIRAM